jgi:hypothetical protein
MKKMSICVNSGAMRCQTQKLIFALHGPKQIFRRCVELICMILTSPGTGTLIYIHS